VEFTAATTLLLLACYLSGVFVSTQQVYMYDRDSVLGTSFEFRAIAADEKDADRAVTAALAEIDREAKIVSSYDPSSEFSIWFRTVGQPLPVSREFYETLSLWDQWRQRTNGALNAAAAAVIRVWKTAAAEDREPSQSELSGAVAAVQKVHWRLDPVQRTATHVDQVPLELNSFTKSYIIGKAADAALTASRVSGVVVNIGGDLVVRGRWTEPIEVTDPLSPAENGSPIARLSIRDRAVATSGSYRRGVDIAGRHYSHIVDPRSGRTAEGILSSTVVAPSPVVAGALATAFSVLSPGESKRLAAEFTAVEYLLVERDGKRVESPGWRRLESPRPQLDWRSPVPTVYAADQTWNPAFELDVTLRIARIDQGGARRPYVAVWIEDAKKYPVRMLALWYRKPRYLDEMHAWFREEQIRSSTEGTQLPASVTGATRPAGVYTLKWDGKDNLGRFVSAGKYSVAIEAAREHGTYQLIRREMDFNGTPQQIHPPGNAEISSATLDYHRIGAR
jgi:thiamine biosynthesis lipoprotein ApbE